MELVSGTWYQVSNVPKTKDSVYTLVISAGTVTDVAISADGATTGITLADAITPAPSAHDLRLSNDLWIKQEGGTSVQLV